MKKRIAMVSCISVLLLLLGIVPAFAAVDADDKFSSNSNSNAADFAGNVTYDGFGSPVYWGHNIRPDLLMSTEATPAPVGFLYDATRVPTDINPATPGIYGKTIQNTGTHFSHIFNLFQYPGISGGVEGIWYLNTLFFSPVGYATDTIQYVIGVDVTKPSAVAGFSAYPDTTGAVPVSGPLATDRIQLRWTDAEYDVLSGTSYYQMYLDGDNWPSDAPGESGRVYLFGYLPASLTVEDLPIGAHKISISAVDRAGNVGPKSDVDVVVDIDVPEVSLTEPTSGKVMTVGQVFSATASDEAGVKSVSFYIDGILVGSDSSSPYSMTPNFTSFANGSHTVTAMVEDLYGRQVTTPGRSVTLDKTVPVIGSFAVTPHTFYPRKHDHFYDYSYLKFNLSKESDVKVRVYNSAGTVVRTMSYHMHAGNHSVTWNGHKDGGVLAPAGSYHYRITATDAIGNVATSVVRYCHLAYYQIVKINSSTARVISR